MRKYYRCGAALSVFILSSLTAAQAIAQSISISEQATMDFGTLRIPVSGTQYMDLPPDGTALTGTGTQITGTTVRGEYKLRRTGSRPPPTISIDVQNVSTGNANLTFSNFKGIYDGTNITSFPRGGLAEPGTGQGKTLFLGARATYNNSLPDMSSFTPSFDIVVLFE